MHCFEGFRGDPVKTRRLPFFQLVNSFLDFAECNGIINGGHAWFLFEEIENRIINRSVIVEHISEM